jgi:nitrate/nitrite transport system substrate-binding protein
MVENLHPAPNASARKTALRLGFVPLNNCAPIVMTRQLGLFEKCGVEVELSREVGLWCACRSRVNPAAQHRGGILDGHFS